MHTEEVAARCRDLVEHSPAALALLDLEGRLVFVNRRAARMLGYDTADEIVARGRFAPDMAIAENCPRASMDLRQLLASGADHVTEGTLINKDGTTFTAEISLDVVRDDAGQPTGYSVALRKVGVRGPLRASPNEAENWFAPLLRSLTDGVWMASGDGREFLYTNPALERIYGRTAAEFRQNPNLWIQAIHPEDQAHGERSAHVLFEQDASGAEYRIVRPDGEIRWIHDRKVLIRNADGKGIRMGGIATDITDCKQAEESERTLLQRVTSLTSHTVELERAQEAAEAASRAKSEFLANIGHELRTPLGVITGFAELLEERLFGDLNAKQEEYVRDILGSARHLLNLINDILDLSKVEAGKAELELSSVAIASLLDESLVMVKERCRTRQIALSLDIPAPVRDLVISADERKLKRVLYNLLSNAVKFTPDRGAITLSAQLCDDASPLHPSPLPGSLPCIQVSVSDTGLGIAREHQEKVFDQFYQVARGARGKTPGTGVGLALTRRLVKLHGGTIWLESEGEGKGSTFHVALPLRE